MLAAIVAASLSLLLRPSIHISRPNGAAAAANVAPCLAVASAPSRATALLMAGPRKTQPKSAKKAKAKPAPPSPPPQWKQDVDAKIEAKKAEIAGSVAAAKAEAARLAALPGQKAEEAQQAAAAAQAAAEAKFEAAKQAATEAQEEAARLAALPGQTFAAAELALSRPLKILSLEEEEAELRLQLEALVASQRGVEETLGRVTAERAALEREDAEAAAGGETVIGKVVPIAAGVGKAVAAVNRLTTSLPLPKKAE
mmetsp:Transcript_11450/g.37642  ORF Transcript_11450/g.37642 Transcript_11450/m.37642 type:complete len:255 (-) Transcript_11450:247-1011(-)